jgi:hypothetical protein
VAPTAQVICALQITVTQDDLDYGKITHQLVMTGAPNAQIQESGEDRICHVTWFCTQCSAALLFCHCAMYLFVDWDMTHTDVPQAWQALSMFVQLYVLLHCSGFASLRWALFKRLHTFGMMQMHTQRIPGCAWIKSESMPK